MSQFWIDVYNAANVKQNEHTQAVSNVRITDRISQIGECEFSMPAAVATQIGAAYGKKYRLYHETLGDLGKYTHYDSTTDADQRTVTIKCYDSLVELANLVAGFGKSFVGATFASIVSGTLTLVGRTATFESGFDSTQVLPSLEFQGESFLRALDVVRQYVRGFFRRESDSVVHFGDFSATTPVFRLYSPALAYADASGDYATIAALKRERRGTGVVNTVFPFGAGVGETVVDLRYSSRTTPYTIQSGGFYGGQVVYYIRDTASLALYGETDRVLSLTEVRPITNSAADLQNAANAVYDLAAAYLQKSASPIDAYSLSCINLPMTTRVGDLIRVDYQGVATLEDEAVAWLSLDNQKFFVTEITRDFGASGEPTAQLTVSTNGEEIVGTTEVFSTLMGDVGSLKLRVQPSMTMFNKASPTLPIDPTRSVEFSFYIGSEMLAINEMKVEFTLMPLRSPVSVAATVASTVATTSTEATSVQTTTTEPSSVQATANNAAVTQSSAAGSGFHTHNLFVDNVGLGSAVFWDGSKLISSAGGTASALPIVATDISHTHSVDIPSHNHTVSIPAHSHSLTIPSHSHTLTIPGHSHSLAFGVIDDVMSPVGVSVQINGDLVSHIINAATGVDIGNTASGAGLYIVDILDTILAQGDFRNKTHTVLFQCVGNQGQLFAQLLSRVTIQPIGVA